MDQDHRVVDTLVIQGNRIISAGDRAQTRRWIRSPAVRAVDLRQATVLPGFVDAHSHFPAGGLRKVVIDLSAPPIGTVGTREQLLERIAAAVRVRRKSGWILGFNYDNAAFADGLHPTRAQLDAISEKHPVYLWHSSGHMGVANSRALEALGIDDSVESTATARYGRNLADGRLNGLLQERAAPSLARLLSELPRLDLWRAFRVARDNYLAAGVTTVQNGHADTLILRLLDLAGRMGVLPQRVLVWPTAGALEDSSVTAHCNGRTRTGFVCGAVKLIVDGSPQGFTAWLEQPYATGSGTLPGYRGFAALPLDELNERIDRLHAEGRQLALHGNGDAAIDAILDALQKAQQRTPRDDTRHILVHAQLLRREQIERAQTLGLTPSFFVSHIWYWGDWHRHRSLGKERAARLSPAGWAVDLGMRFSLHADSPVTPMQPMQLVWSATTRRTASGTILGPELRIERDQALRALTIDAAWQNFIDDSRGSLEAGKLADFVILSADPYQVADVRRVQVMQTYIGGHRVYQRASPEAKHGYYQ